MDNIESRWIKQIIIACLIGFGAGELISYVLGLFLTTSNWDLFLSLLVPAFVIFGLIIVLMRYQKEKDEMINGTGNE